MMNLMISVATALHLYVSMFCYYIFSTLDLSTIIHFEHSCCIQSYNSTIIEMIGGTIEGTAKLDMVMQTMMVY